MAAQGTESPSDGVVVRTGRERYRTEVEARGHRLVADEPVVLGGTDQGPTPFEYVAAALGACTSITLRMYADRKEMALEEVIVRVRHEKTNEPGKGRVDRLYREIELVGALSDAERARLLEIADRCPVHRAIEAGIEIVTTAAPLAAVAGAPAAS
jgi:putative redox protein